MLERSTGVKRALAGVLLTVMIAALSSCADDPYDPHTWIKKLDDPAQVQNAVTHLEQLKDPVAIKPLAKVWRKHNHWSRALRVIIELADQPKKKGGPFWKQAIPVLTEAVQSVDLGDRRSIDDAVAATTALGKAHDPDTVQTLINAATKKMPKLSPGQNERIAALQALGKFSNNPRALDTLIKVLGTDPKHEQPVVLNAAAADALAQSGNPKAIHPLLFALFRISAIYQQVRAAVTRVGRPAIPPLMEIFEGKDAKINKFARDNGFATNCDKAFGPKTQCKAPGNLQFKSAELLGDLHARKAVPILVKALHTEGKTAFFNPRTGAPGPSSHNAILDALSKIGDPRSASALYAYMVDPKTDDTIRPIAIDKYSMVADNTKALGYLGKVIKSALKDSSQDAQSAARAAAMAYGRLARRRGQLGPLDYMIHRYQKVADKAKAAANKATKKDEKSYQQAQAAGYTNFVRMFQEDKARALIGIKCGHKLACYTKVLKTPSAALVKEIQSLGVKGATKFKHRAKSGLVVAAQERALLEISKMGPKAASATDALLKMTDSTTRIIRQGVLLALQNVAPKPCTKCVKRLKEVIESQKDQTTLDYLTADTRVVENYFRWAGKND